jgi:hypothetical protein
MQDLSHERRTVLLGVAADPNANADENGYAEDDGDDGN